MKRLALLTTLFSAALLSPVTAAPDSPTTKPAPAPVVVVQPDGSLLLKAEGARVLGFHLHLEQKPTPALVYWIDQNEYPEWPKAVAKKGTYTVEVTYSCAPHAGGEFAVVAAANRVTGTTHNTADWKTFDTQKLANLTVLNDDTTIAVRCNRLDHALMDIQSIKLTLVPTAEKKK